MSQRDFSEVSLTYLNKFVVVHNFIISVCCANEVNIDCDQMFTPCMLRTAKGNLLYGIATN